jgi:hypothetical protein
VSKAELARRMGRNPASIRRLFTAEQARPELPLIISIANALDASVEVKPHSRRSTDKRARAPRCGSLTRPETAARASATTMGLASHFP